MGITKEAARMVTAKRLGISFQEFCSLTEAGLKHCQKCLEWKSVNEFNSDITRWDHKSPKCQSCTRVKVKKTHKGRVSTFLGKTHSEENKKKFSEYAKSRKPPMQGRKHTLESRKKMSESSRLADRTGEKCHLYKDGKTAERRGIRFSSEYKRWRFDVFVRDSFACQHCGDAKGGNLCAHHIKPFADFPDLRLVLENGLTLCKKCHKKVHAKTS